MKYFIIISLIVFIFFSCSKQTTNITLLNKEHIKRLLDTISNPPNKGLADFKSIAINGGIGKICRDSNCLEMEEIFLPSGILISEEKAYEFSYYKEMVKNVNKRLKNSLKYINNNMELNQKKDSIENN